MPTYVYRCPKCGHEFQKFHKMNVKARPRCPECGTTAERTITGGAGLLFKGSGFYITDYKKGPDKAEKADGAGKADTADGGGRSPPSAAKKKKPDAGAKGSDS